MKGGPGQNQSARTGFGSQKWSGGKFCVDLDKAYDKCQQREAVGGSKRLCCVWKVISSNSEFV